MLDSRQEGKFLALWVQEALEDLRLNWGPEYRFGMMAGDRFGELAAWRADGTGDLMTAESPGDLRKLVRADVIADRDARNGTTQ